jgi:general L-amino acid transport system permease protein
MREISDHRPNEERPENIAAHVEEPSEATLHTPSPRSGRYLFDLVHRHLFNSVPNTLLTVLCLWLLWDTLPPLLSWGVVKATWSGTPETCRAGTGACWAIVTEKHRFMLFGLYPYAEQWRPALAIALFIAMLAISVFPALWGRRLVIGWGVALAVCALLMWGGLFGLDVVPNERWGGLPLTLVLSVVGIAAAIPLGIVLALGRRSDLPAIRAVCVGYIEIVRGVPLVSVLFMASVMFPLFLPEGVTIDKLLRAQVGIILFTAAYLAEAVRAGLQALPRGQYEAADALGLGYWQKQRLIILPQALRIVIPPMVNQFISAFKDTSLVMIIGLYDLLNAAKGALADPPWRPFSIEVYAFTALVFWAFCFFMSRYSQFLERRLNAATRR